MLRLAILKQVWQTAVTSPNPVIIPIYNYCVKNNKTVVVTSDMYLSEDIIRRILTKNGFEGYTNIFVSSEFGEKKRNGKLFKRVVDELRVKPKEILHIGDNIRSDVIFANLSGIKGVQIAKLKTICQNKNITQYALAKATGMSTSSISCLMRGETKPYIYTVLTICDALNVTIGIPPNIKIIRTLLLPF